MISSRANLIRCCDFVGNKLERKIAVCEGLSIYRRYRYLVFFISKDSAKKDHSSILNKKQIAGLQVNTREFDYDRLG